MQLDRLRSSLAELAGRTSVEYFGLLASVCLTDWPRTIVGVRLGRSGAASVRGRVGEWRRGKAGEGCGMGRMWARTQEPSFDLGLEREIGVRSREDVGRVILCAMFPYPCEAGDW